MLAQQTVGRPAQIFFNNSLSVYNSHSAAIHLYMIRPLVTDDVVDATADVNKNPLKWTYTDKHCLSVENTGSSWRVNIDGSGSSKFRRIQKTNHEVVFTE